MNDVLIVEEKDKVGLFIDGKLISVFKNQNSNDVLGWVKANISNVKVNIKGGVIRAPKKHEVTFR